MAKKKPDDGTTPSPNIDDIMRAAMQIKPQPKPPAKNAKKKAKMKSAKK